VQFGLEPGQLAEEELELLEEDEELLMGSQVMQGKMEMLRQVLPSAAQ
jgi:hypothetical protein